MSAALDSIADCSESEYDDETSSDEETGSYYFRQAQPRVWKYGDSPTTDTMSKKNSSLQKQRSKDATMSKHDRIMRRERLLQEEYEYRLHSLKRENEKLSRKFRIFVLVAVALIFAGALAFAFVVCIRMLMSI